MFDIPSFKQLKNSSFFPNDIAWDEYISEYSFLDFSNYIRVLKKADVALNLFGLIENVS